MSHHIISIPHELYTKAELIAQQNSQSVDDVIRSRLEVAFDESFLDLPVDEQSELKAMAYLSDDALWTLAREQMRQNAQTRMLSLMDKNTHGTITDTEYTELAELVERGNKLTLRKSQAMKYLLDRGHTITQHDLNPTSS